MSVETHKLQRSLSAMTLGSVRDYENRLDRGESLEALQEVDSVHQLPISGEAGTIIAWSMIEIEFGVHFHEAPVQRDSPYWRPIFTYGTVIDSDTPVAITACVMRWNHKGEGAGSPYQGAIRGARVAVGAHSPGAITAIRFKGRLHVCFTGYGSLDDQADEG